MVPIRNPGQYGCDERLALDCVARKVLGDDVEIRITIWDETNTRIRNRPHHHPDPRRRRPRNGLCWSGCKRTSIRGDGHARAASRRRHPGLHGGFHVSGTLAMLPETPPELVEAMDLGITLLQARPSEGSTPAPAAWRNARAALQIHERSSRHGGRAWDQYLPAEVVARPRVCARVRCRARCPFLCSLHHHQRAGTQVTTRTLTTSSVSSAPIWRKACTTFHHRRHLARNQHWEAYSIA